MVAEEYCWVITQVSGQSCCGRSDSSVLVFGFQLYSLVCTYTVDKAYTQFRNVQNWTCAGPTA